MGRLRTEEVRRLLRYLSERVEDPERLAEKIFGRTRGKLITLRADVDLALDESGEAHAVTVLVGRGDESQTIAVGPV